MCLKIKSQTSADSPFWSHVGQKQSFFMVLNKWHNSIRCHFLTFSLFRFYDKNQLNFSTGAFSFFNSQKHTFICYVMLCVLISFWSKILLLLKFWKTNNNFGWEKIKFFNLFVRILFLNAIGNLIDVRFLLRWK